MRRLLYVLPVMLFALVAAWFAVPLIEGRDPSLIPSALIDEPVPRFDLPPLPGRKQGLSSADLRGEVRLVNVFASWCVPCRVEHPQIERLAEMGVPVHAINYKDEPEAALAWLEAEGDPFVSIGADRDGRVAIDWGVYGVPETFIVDREGRIRYRHVGPIMPRDLEQVILPRIAELRR